MASDELNGRKIFTSSFDFRAPSLFSTDAKHRLNQAMPALTAAVAGAADLFAVDGQIVGLIDGELDVMNAAALGKVIRENLVRKGIRNAGTVETPIWEREFRGVEVGEVVLRMLLVDERYGLLGLLPVLHEEDLMPRLPEAAVAEAPPPATPTPTVMNEAEAEASRRVSERWARLGSAEQNRLERERGAEVVARAQARQNPTA